MDGNDAGATGQCPVKHTQIMAKINRHPDVGRYLNRPVDDAAVDPHPAKAAGYSTWSCWVFLGS